ncbi:MAG TPA: ModD protein, partial [Campylobacterales bacterium]|nr:ModD protein [Campylobacterales bacterium]
DTILTASGDAKAVLKAWKPSQNILEYASAVATQTAKMVEAIKAVSPHTHFATTRKTIPNTKKLAIKAVLCGGGYAHRLGLSESVLIFAQYAALAGMSLEECIQKAKQQTMEHKIAVEVKNKPDAIAAAKAGADIVQCDKLEIDEMRGTVAAVKSVDSRITIIATGGINLQNAASYAAAKPDIIVSSSVYYSKPFDVKVTIEPA